MKHLKFTRAGNKHLGAANMVYETCSSCQFWNTLPNELLEVEYGDDVKEKVRKGGYCDSVLMYEYEHNEPGHAHMIEEDALVAFGAQRIWTGPHFGCVHWSPNE